MALFTDGLCTSLEDMPKYDSSVLAVCASEGIDLGAKLALAQEHLASDLEALLAGEALEKVVATPALRAAHAFAALEQVYRDAYNSQLNDRYEGRWRQYERLRRENWHKVVENGIGLVDEPVAKAAVPEIWAAAGTGGVGGNFYVRVAWVNARGEEGAASDVAAADVPTGASLAARATKQPPHSAGWNIYAGPSPDGCTRQNTTMLAGGEQWVQVGQLRDDGEPARNGQIASYVRAIPRLLRRG
jgi:hypothetical protein